MRGFVLALGAGAALVASASASTTTFFAEDFNPTGVGTGGMPNSVGMRATFASNLVGVGTEDFEGFAVGTTVPPPLAINFVGAGTATLNATTSTLRISNDPRSAAGRWATSGSNYVETDAGGDFNITFNNPGGVAAFGFYGTDLGDFGNQLTLRLTRTDNSTYDVVVPHSLGSNGSTDGRAIFFGLIATAGDTFTRVEFLNNPGGVDVFGFDDMMVGSLQQVVPLPTAAWMGLAGLAGAGLVRRRRGR